METIYLALGANVGSLQANIAQAIKLLGAKLQRIERAQLYTTKPVGYTDQPDFLNTAVRAQTALAPEELLTFLKAIEQAVGRVDRFRWGPREIDIDIIFYGNHVLTTSPLTIPHSRFAERDFVLRPLCDLAPDFIDPVSKRPLKELLAALPTSQLSVIGPESKLA